jgi:hypothetical protein
MGRGIGTMVVAELAIVAFINDPVMIRRSEFRHVTLIFIDPIQQSVEGRAEIETAATSVAYVVDA